MKSMKQMRAAQWNGGSERRPKQPKAARQAKGKEKQLLLSWLWREKPKKEWICSFPAEGLLVWFGFFSLWVNGAGTAQCSAKRETSQNTNQTHSLLFLFNKEML